MATESSLNHSMDSAIKHYSSMFFLPSYRTAFLAVAIICIGGVSLCSFALFRSINSLFLGLALFVITLATDIITSQTILKKDLIFLTRRNLAMSYFCWLLWLGFIALGVALEYALGLSVLWIKLALLGFGAVVTLRAIVLGSVSSVAGWKKVLSALLQPVLSAIAFLTLWSTIQGSGAWSFLVYIIIAPILAFVAVYIFLSSIDRLGKSLYSLSALPMFRAFILNWVTDANEPMEKYLEEMGGNSDIEVTYLKFDTAKPKAAIIVPQVHPGPFKNIGSSLLPSMMKHEFDKEFSCDSCVPLGILGHELDLASQPQNHKIVSQVIANARFEAKNALASPLVRVTEGTATSSCQIFGDTAFLSFTLAPKTTEDLPQELGRYVSDEAKKLGLKDALVVNTHNAIDNVMDTNEHLTELQLAATKCLQKAVATPTKPFMVGAATVNPTEFNLKMGMGTGGITAIVVQVETQKTAYVVIDGNNMVPYLREKILESLTKLGFSDSEVFTTDTHAVSALVTGRRGYHPVGDVMGHDLLIRYINDLAKKAESNLEAAKAESRTLIIPQVRVIGEERLKSVTTLVDKAIVKAKHAVAPIFGIEGLLLILLLVLL